jgi:hypothetical protein
MRHHIEPPLRRPRSLQLFQPDLDDSSQPDSARNPCASSAEPAIEQTNVRLEADEGHTLVNG